MCPTEHDFMSLIAPGLKKHFGSAKKPMQLRIYMKEAPTMHTSASKGASAAADIRLEFSVVSQTEDVDVDVEDSMARSVARYLGLVDDPAGSQVAFTLGGHASCELSFDVVSAGSGQLLQAEIEKFDLGTWSVASSAVGTVNLVDGLLNLVSKVIEDIGVPAINAVLKKGMPLPSAKSLKLKNTVLQTRNEYILVASDFDFSL